MRRYHCTDAHHAVADGPWRVQSSAVLLEDCGDDELFDCCTLTVIQDRMTSETEGAVPIDEFIASLGRWG